MSGRVLPSLLKQCEEPSGAIEVRKRPRFSANSCILSTLQWISTFVFVLKRGCRAMLGLTAAFLLASAALISTAAQYARCGPSGKRMYATFRLPLPLRKRAIALACVVDRNRRRELPPGLELLRRWRARSVSSVRVQWRMKALKSSRPVSVLVVVN